MKNAYCVNGHGHGGNGVQQSLHEGDTDGEKLVCPEGLEPPTCCLEGNCSIQLSYGQMEERIPRKKAHEWAFLKGGRSGGIRTRDPLLPKQMRYQAALRSDKGLL